MGVQKNLRKFSKILPTFDFKMMFILLWNFYPCKGYVFFNVNKLHLKKCIQITAWIWSIFSAWKFFKKISKTSTTFLFQMTLKPFPNFGPCGSYDFTCRAMSTSKSNGIQYKISQNFCIIKIWKKLLLYFHPCSL